MSRRAGALLTLLLAGCAAGPGPVPPAPPGPPPVTPAPVTPAPAPEPTPVPEPPPPPPPPLPPIRIAAVGDIMMGTDYPQNRLPADDGAGTFAAVAHILRAADLTFGNLEGVLMDGGEPFKVCKDPSLCYLFRTPARYVRYLADAGFDLISLANNHARDFGEDGRSASMAHLAAAGIAHSGREGDIASVRAAGRRVAMIAFAPNPGSHSINDIAGAAARVAELSATHDLVIVSFHGGAEGLDALNVPHGMELYYGEQRGDLRAFSHAVVDAGADLVIGHGPHVVRGIEIYNDRLIAYSLGNFATAFGISVAGLKGIAPILIVELGPDGAFVEGQIVATKQSRARGLELDPDLTALELIAKLSADDFGERAPRFHADGRLTR